MKIKDPNVIHILEAAVGSFVGMIIALAWTDFFNSILTPIQKKFVFLGIIGYLIYAIITTIFAVFLIIIFIKLTKDAKKNEK